MDIGRSESEKKWYWRKRDSDERNGPVSTQKLLKLAEIGDLRTEDLVWKDGMSDWRKANTISTLSMQGVLEEPESEDSKWDGYYRYLGYFFYPSRVLSPLISNLFYPISYVSFYIPFGIIFSTKRYKDDIEEATNFAVYLLTYSANVLIPIILFTGTFTPESQRTKAVEACEKKVRKENDVVHLFGRSNPMIGGVADEDSSYPGSVAEIGDGEYIIDGFVSTERITTENTYGDAYEGSHFECKVKVTKEGARIVSFYD